MCVKVRFQKLWRQEQNLNCSLASKAEKSFWYFVGRLYKNMKELWFFALGDLLKEEQKYVWDSLKEPIESFTMAGSRDLLHHPLHWYLQESWSEDCQLWCSAPGGQIIFFIKYEKYFLLRFWRVILWRWRWMLSSITEFQIPPW